jgi:hypothetical protein
VSSVQPVATGSMPPGSTLEKTWMCVLGSSASTVREEFLQLTWIGRDVGNGTGCRNLSHSLTNDSLERAPNIMQGCKVRLAQVQVGLLVPLDSSSSSSSSRVKTSIAATPDWLLHRPVLVPQLSAEHGIFHQVDLMFGVCHLSWTSGATHVHATHEPSPRSAAA